MKDALMRMETHLVDYQCYFRNKTKIFFDKAVIYTQGVIKAELRNIERISETLGANYHQMQHFITESNWDARQVIDKVAQEVNAALPRRKMTGLILDESGWQKKGHKSVGVGHQYCGNVGKTANCQVAVFACLSNGDYASLIDARLYLPKDWCNDPIRCSKAGIPKADQQFKTKLELAADIIKHQKANGISFDFISADGYYGNDPEFARMIEGMGHIYMLDIHSNQRIYLQEPEFYIPERKHVKGIQPKKKVTDAVAVNVSEYMSTLRPEDWRELIIRNSSKGKLKANYHIKRVFIWDKKADQVEARMLVIRKSTSEHGTDIIKYSFTNANLDQYTPEGLAYMQAERFFIEHSLKESKQILGMDQFQTRKWVAWYHQIALNFMVSSFILKEKLLCKEEIPLLSARDVKEYLTFKLYKEMTEEEMAEQIYHRHQLRQNDINRYYSSS